MKAGIYNDKITKNVAILSFVTVPGFVGASCSKTAEEKVAGEAREFCVAMGNPMASPAEKTDTARFQKSLDKCPADMTEDKLRRLKNQ